MLLWIIFGAFAILSMIVSWTLKSKFKKYSEIPLQYTGAQIAMKMLQRRSDTRGDPNARR